MDPPPPLISQPPPLATASVAATTASTILPTAAPAAPAACTYPDSIDSSPRSRTTESYFDDPPPPPPLSSKLRLMCSYGGHIVPRPHDKSLCYVGGDTRIVVVDRHTTLSALSARLSGSLLNGRPFTLKYQLPSEDLDSLISVTTDEDLDNMIDEYDRTNNNSNGSKSRLRLFLFSLKPESSQSLGPILESSGKSEDWFLNALNGAGVGGLLNRGFSESASVNCLLGLDDANLDLGAGGVGGGVKEKNPKHSAQDVHSVPDSPMLETTSSFGSTSSSPSLANLPPIRVHAEDGGGGGGGSGRGVLQDPKVVVGIEEQFAQMSVGGQLKQQQQQQQDEGFVVLSSPPPMPVSIMPLGNPVMVGDYANRVFSDDERSDHGVPVCYRKVSPPQTQTQQKSSGSGGGVVDLPSPDSVSSDSSLSNAVNRQKPMTHPDQVMQVSSGVGRVPVNPVDPKITNFLDPNTRYQIQQQVQDLNYVMQPQFDQQQQQPQPQPSLQQQQQQPQYVHAGAHYIHHHIPGAVPISAYYPVYPPQQQQHHQIDQQYPLYYVQARQPQVYNLPIQQSGISDAAATTIPTSCPQTPPHPNPTLVPPPAAYNPARSAHIAKPEMAAGGMCRTTATGAPQLVQVPSSQHQQQYVGYPQVHHPTQSVAPTSTSTANYAYEFVEPGHAQFFYTQPLPPQIPAPYQTMTAAAAGVLPEASAQLPTGNIKQQMRTSKPI